MAENDEHSQIPDRRLTTLVYDLDKKVHALELVGAKQEIKIAGLEGEISGLRSSSATSAEVAAASRLIDVRFDQVHKDLAGIKSILIWGAGIIAAALLGAFRFGLIVTP